MKMRNFTLLLAFALFSPLLRAQSAPEIIFNEKKEVWLNGKMIDHGTTMEELTALLGEAEVHKEYPTGKLNYHYPDLGMAVHIVNGQLLYLGMNFNWDGDERFPEERFTGKLSMGKVVINAETSPEVIEELTVVEIFCPIPEMCMTKDREAQTPIMLGFKEGKITQIGFEFH